MTAAIRDSVVAGFPALVLENGSVQVTVIPGLGGRIWSLVDRLRGREWIWHRPGVSLATAAPGAAYDDIWCGGWEELFPNDAPAQLEGRSLPDHGEWWSRAWRVTRREEDSSASIRLEAEMTAVPARCVKEIRLPADGGVLEVSYRIAGIDRRPAHVLFKQHFAARVTPGCRIVLPGGKASAVDPSFGQRVSTPGEFDWPYCRGNDLAHVPAPSPGCREFLYIRAMPAAWCGVDDPAADAALRLRFDARVFPYVWLFLTYGGWRDLNVAVLEPCTNMPKDLAEAIRLGQSARLGPGEEITTQVSVALTGLAEAAAGDRSPSDARS